MRTLSGEAAANLRQRGKIPVEMRPAKTINKTMLPEAPTLDRGHAEGSSFQVREPVEEVVPEAAEERTTPSKGEVCVLGTPALDEILVLDAYPSEGGSSYVEEMYSLPGGTGANVAYILAQLGVATSFIAAHGDDETGVVLVNSLAIVDVDTWSCYAVKGTSSKKIVTTLSPGKERTFLVHPGASLDDGHPVDLGRVLAHELVYLDALRPDILQSIAAAEMSPLTVATLHPWWEEKLAMQLLRKASYVVCSEAMRARYEQRLHDSLADPESLLRAYVSLHPVLGAALYEPSGVTKFSALPVPSVDFTGAEEGFVAGVIYSLLRGAPLAAGLKLALLLASHAQTEIGARGPFSNVEILGLLLKSSVALDKRLAPYF